MSETNKDKFIIYQLFSRWFISFPTLPDVPPLGPQNVPVGWNNYARGGKNSDKTKRKTFVFLQPKRLRIDT